MAQSKPHTTLRDKSRTCERKAAALHRRDDRRGKSARLFLSLAFPAELVI